MIYLVELSDKRNIILLELLKEKYQAGEFKFDAHAGCYALDEAAVVFSPARKLTPDEAAKLPPVKFALGGSQREEILHALKERGVTYVNLIGNESYAVKNALLTAEGALALVIGNSAKSGYENNILILGCGRVGKAVALLLQRLGVKTSIATFDKAELDALPFYTASGFYGYSFADRLGDYDVIINTIPKMILDGACLQKVKADTAVLELASVDCLDKGTLDNYPFKYIPAGGLPMKYSPESAARLMLECIEDSINEINC